MCLCSKPLKIKTGRILPLMHSAASVERRLDCQTEHWSDRIWYAVYQVIILTYIVCAG